MTTPEIDEAFVDMIENKKLPHYDVLRDGKFSIATATIGKLVEAIKTSVHIGTSSAKLVEEFIWRIGEREELLEEYFDGDGSYCGDDVEFGAELRGHGYGKKCSDAKLSVRYIHVSTQAAANAKNARLFRWLLERHQPIADGTLECILGHDDLECLKIFKEIRPKRLAKQINQEMMELVVRTDARACMETMYNIYAGHDPDRLDDMVDYAYSIDSVSFIQFMLSRDSDAVRIDDPLESKYFKACMKAPEARIMKYLIGVGLVDHGIWEFNHRGCSDAVFQAYLGAGIFPDLDDLLTNIEHMPTFYLISAVKHVQDKLSIAAKIHITTHALYQMTDEKALDVLRDIGTITADTVDIYQLIIRGAGSGLCYLQKNGFYLDKALINMQRIITVSHLETFLRSGVVLPAEFGSAYRGIPEYAAHLGALNGNGHSDSDRDDEDE